eukprot:6230375-Ditylum_brightwellii.AAC.1
MPILLGYYKMEYIKEKKLKETQQITRDAALKRKHTKGHKQPCHHIQEDGFLTAAEEEETKQTNKDCTG